VGDIERSVLVILGKVIIERLINALKYASSTVPSRLLHVWDQ